MRLAGGPYLKFDTSLKADQGVGQVSNWREIPLLIEEGMSYRLNEHVAISGKLGRFGSALVEPPIFIEVARLIDPISTSYTFLCTVGPEAYPSRCEHRIKTGTTMKSAR